MPLILSGNVASATADAGYSVANSCRFNDGDSAYLTRTTETPTNADKATFSFWVKRCTLGTEQSFFSERRDHNNLSNILFDTSDRLWIYSYNSGNEYIFLVTNRVFRDVGAWMHIFCVFDTSQGTAANRVKIYINGVQETSFDTSGSGSVYPDENQNLAFNETGLTLRISNLNSDQYLDCYLAEVAYVDGVAHAVTDFGEFDEDSPTIWKPKDISSGITWGTNGFYLDFEDSGDLGDDESGNTNDFAETNLAAIDQATDTPTNNFATYNSLFAGDPNLTYSEGNLKLTTTSGGEKNAVSTIAVTSGKWYAEFMSTTGTNYPGFGIMDTGSSLQTTVAYLGGTADSYAMFQDGNYYTNDSADNTGTTWGEDVIMGVGIDLDSATKTIKFYKDGSEEHSATIATPANGYVFAVSQDTDGVISETNFGNPITALSSAVADANGYGNFEFAPPSGYFALCTKNLAEYG